MRLQSFLFKSFILAALFTVALTAAAQSAGEPSASQKYFTDVELVNQNGDKMRLYSDVLKGRVVIINSFFATCTGACPVMGRNLEKIQTALGNKLGKEVFIVSMTVDPIADTPANLKAYAAKWDAKPGWHFLTGTKANVDLALRKLGYYVEDKTQHTTVMIIGNDRTGLWKKAFGLASPEELMKIIDSVINDKGSAPTPPAKP